MLRVDGVVHYYINFVSIFNVVCVSSLTRRPPPPPHGEGPSDHRPYITSPHQEMSPCCPAVSFGYGAAHQQTNATTPYLLYIIRIYSHPPPSLGCLEAPSRLSYVLRTADKVYRSLLRCPIYYI